MQKTIIAIHGKANEGKSSTIKNVCKIIMKSFPEAESSIKPIDYKEDINLIVKIGEAQIGFESKGNPKEKTICKNTVNKLAKRGCDIIICATRSSEESVLATDEIGEKYGYKTLWISSFWSPSLNKNVLNQKSAENIVDIIKSIIVTQL